MNRRVAPPSGGEPPPAEAWLGERRVDLTALAEQVCTRYYEEFADEHDRYGEAGVAWCRHDNQWILAWAIADVTGGLDLERQVLWLARVLFHRDFPVDRLARDLELAAEVAPSAEVAGRLRDAAAAVLDALESGRLA